MDLQTKTLEGAPGGNCLILIARGALTEGTLRQTLEKISATRNTHGVRKFLVDFEYTTIIRKGELDIDEVLTTPDLSLDRCRIVFVCPMGSGHYGPLRELSSRLSQRGLSAAVFIDTKSAAEWLAQVIEGTPR
jgi:hypothetical protein